MKSKRNLSKVRTQPLLEKPGTLRPVEEPLGDSPTAILMSGILSLFADFEKSMRSERIRAGMQRAKVLNKGHHR